MPCLRWATVRVVSWPFVPRPGYDSVRGLAPQAAVRFRGLVVAHAIDLAESTQHLVDLRHPTLTGAFRAALREWLADPEQSFSATPPAACLTGPHRDHPAFRTIARTWECASGTELARVAAHAEDVAGWAARANGWNEGQTRDRTHRWQQALVSALVAGDEPPDAPSLPELVLATTEPSDDDVVDGALELDDLADWTQRVVTELTAAVVRAVRVAAGPSWSRDDPVHRYLSGADDLGSASGTAPLSPDTPRAVTELLRCVAATRTAQATLRLAVERARTYARARDWPDERLRWAMRYATEEIADRFVGAAGDLYTRLYVGPDGQLSTAGAGGLIQSPKNRKVRSFVPNSARNWLRATMAAAGSGPAESGRTPDRPPAAADTAMPVPDGWHEYAARQLEQATPLAQLEFADLLARYVRRLTAAVAVLPLRTAHVADVSLIPGLRWPADTAPAIGWAGVARQRLAAADSGTLAGDAAGTAGLGRTLRALLPAHWATTLAIEYARPGLADVDVRHAAALSFADLLKALENQLAQLTGDLESSRRIFGDAPSLPSHDPWSSLPVGLPVAELGTRTFCMPVDQREQSWHTVLTGLRSSLDSPSGAAAAALGRIDNAVDALGRTPADSELLELSWLVPPLDGSVSPVNDLTYCVAMAWRSLAAARRAVPPPDRRDDPATVDWLAGIAGEAEHAEALTVAGRLADQLGFPSQWLRQTWLGTSSPGMTWPVADSDRVCRPVDRHTGRTDAEPIRTRPRVAWQRQVPADKLPEAPIYRLLVNSSALFVSISYVMSGDYYGGLVDVNLRCAALDAQSGTPIRSWRAGLSSVSGPVVLLDRAQRRYVNIFTGADVAPVSGSQDGIRSTSAWRASYRVAGTTVTATDADGAELWSLDIAAEAPAVTAAIASLTPAPGRLYAVTDDGWVICLIPT